MAQFVCFGEILLRLTAPDSELLLQQGRLDAHVGGAEANVAVSLAQFGHTARMASIVPDNALAHAALGALRRHGVDISNVAFAAGRMGLYFFTPGAGPRAAKVLYDRAESAFARAAPDRIDWAIALTGADWLHVSGINCAVSENAAAATLAAVRAARAAGVKVSVDANFRPALWAERGGDPAPVIDALFQEADLLFAGPRDLSLVSGKAVATHEECAALAFARYPKLQRIAATDRAARSAERHDLFALSFTRDGQARSRTHALDAVVDRIGGGDAFAAGLLHALAAGFSESDAIEFAAAAAALKHYIRGDFSLASEADVRACLDNSSPDVQR